MAGVNVTVGADTAQFEAGMKRSRQQLNQLGGELRTGVTQVAKFGAATTLAAAGGLALLARQGLQSVDALAKLARQTGGTIQGMQGLTRIADRAGVSQSALQSATESLNVRLGEAMEGSGAAADRLDQLGLSAANLAGMDVDQRMAALSDAMQNAGMNSAQMGNALRDLGIRQREMVLLMQEGGDAIRESTNFIDQYGLALSEVDAAKVEAANDTFADVQDVLGGISQQLAIEVAPLLEAVSRMFLDAASEAGGLGEVTSSVFDSIVTGVGFAMDAVEGIRRVFILAGQAGATAFAGLVEAVLSVADFIISGPTRAMNEFIELLNKIPGVDIEQVGLSGLGATIERELATARGATHEGMKAMQATLNEPMPSIAFKQYVEEARESAQEAAEATVAGRANQDAMLLDMAEETGNELSEKRREQLQKDLMELRAANDTELEIIKQKLDDELEVLIEGLQNELLTREEFDELAQEAAQRHEDAINDIEKKARDERVEEAKKEAKEKAAAMDQAFSDMTTLMNTGSRKMFEIGKAAAISNAIIDGKAAVQGAFAVGNRIGGPVVGGAFATAAGAGAYANIQSIRGQAFGSGGGSAASSNTQAINDGSGGVQGNQGQQQNRDTTTTVRLIGGDQTTQLNGEAIINALNKAAPNGMRLRAELLGS